MNLTSEQHDTTIGQTGQKLLINGETFYIGDVVLLTHRKTLKKQHYQLIWSDCHFQVMLENKNNALASVHPSESYWHTEAYIPLFKITENYVPYVGIEIVGNSRKDLKLIERISRVGMKKTK